MAILRILQFYIFYFLFSINLPLDNIKIPYNQFLSIRLALKHVTNKIYESKMINYCWIASSQGSVSYVP